MVHRPCAPEDTVRWTESSLVIVDGMSRVLLSDEVCLSKDARDAVLILLRTFNRWGLPEEIISDNAGAFISLLYQFFLARLQVKVSHTNPGHPWENGQCAM